MATNELTDGDVVIMTAPANVDSGELVEVGHFIGVAVNDADSGDPVPVCLSGVFKLPKAAGVGISAGDRCYNSAGDVTNVESGEAFGICVETVAGGGATVKVRLGVPNEALDATTANLASLAHGKGASLIGIEDIGGCYSAPTTTVEAALHEVKDIADAAAVAATLASSATGEGAALIGIEDAGSDITATTVEGALAELAAPPRVKVAKTTITHFADGNAHDATLTLPAKAAVLDVWYDLRVAAGAGVTLSFGVNGTPGGYMSAAPMDAAIGLKTLDATLDGTNNWFVASVRGALIKREVAGANADDRGLFAKVIDVSSGGKKLAYQASALDATVEVDVYVAYCEM
jgi:predicted RecA/RadA family phage recombinase